MATETIGGGMTQSDVNRAVASGGWKAIVRTPEQQAEYDEWVAESLAQTAAERRQWRDYAMKNPAIRVLNWIFQTNVWKSYKADQAKDIQNG